MIHLSQQVHRWLQAEARQQADVDDCARSVLQALPAPQPRSDLVAAVMAALAPASLWSRRPVRYLVVAAVLVMGIGIVGAVGSAPALTAIAGLSLWRDLAVHLFVVGVDFGVDMLAVAGTTWRTIALSPAAALWRAAALGLAAIMFVAGTLAMTRISMWRDEENWKHA